MQMRIIKGRREVSFLTFHKLIYDRQMDGGTNEQTFVFLNLLLQLKNDSKHPSLYFGVKISINSFQPSYDLHQ